MLQVMDEKKGQTFSLVKIAERDTPGFLKRNAPNVIFEGESAVEVLGKFGGLIDRMGIHASVRSLL